MSSSDDAGFLETVTTDDGDPKTAGPITLATGVKWQKLGATLVGSFIASWFLGLQAIIQSGFKFFTNDNDAQGAVFDALASFLGDLTAAILGVPGRLLSESAETSVSFVETTFSGPASILIFPMGVAILMAGLWAAARGLEVLR